MSSTTPRAVSPEKRACGSSTSRCAMTGTASFWICSGVDKIKAVKQRQRLRGFHQGNGRARAGAQLHAAGRARGGHQVHHVAFQFFADADVFHRALEREHIRQRGDRLQFIKRMVVLLRGEDGDFLGRRHVAERELHGKPVHLRLRQRIGAAKFHRVFAWR